VIDCGTVKHIHGIGHPVLDETGILSNNVGTTRCEQNANVAEEALQRSEGYFSGSAEIDPHRQLGGAGSLQKENVYWSNVYWSKEMYRIFGLDPGPTPPSTQEVARRLHPEYAPDHPRVVVRAIRGGTDF